MMKVAILGGGESGVGAAILASKNGFDAFVSDVNQIAKKYKEELESVGVGFEEGQHTFEKLLDADIVVKSPGIPPEAPVVCTLTDRGMTLVSEVEWASRFDDARIIAITGTNGKTTTTGLCHHLLQTAGLTSVAVGNIGKSYARSVATEDCEYRVVEVSSFQLEDVDSFHPHIAVVLNITPDHLDRYDQLDQYGGAKMKVARNMCASDVFFYIRGRGVEKYLPLLADVDVQGLSVEGSGEMTLQYQEEQFRWSNPFLRGPHNAENVLVCIAIARRLGLERKVIEAGLDDFVNESHRLEQVGSGLGMTFINDSKATNLEAAQRALCSFDAPIFWIVGGVDKGNDYSRIVPLVREKVEVCIALGKDNSKIRASFSSIVKRYVEVGSMEEAVDVSLQYRREGATVLLSPACASFDLFDNYKDRGQKFIDCVTKKLNE